MNILPYGRQNIDEDDIDAVVRVLRGDWLTTGPAVEGFETALCEATSAGHAVACSSGTAALHIAFAAAGVGPGDKVIVPSVTFAASANAAFYVGATPIIADVDAETGLLTPDGLSEAFDRSGGAAAVVPVHLAGQVCDMPGLSAIARREGMKVIEDACHAIGGTIDEGDGVSAVGACAYSDAAAFSFHPVKTVAMGEGGAVTTNDETMAGVMRRLRSHGIRREPDGFINTALATDGGKTNPWYYEIGELGFNYRASDIHCALVLSQMKKLDRSVARRAELVEIYLDLLAPLAPVVRPLGRRGGGRTAWHLFVARIDFAAAGISRGDLMRALRECGVGSQVHYIPLHLMPAFQTGAAEAAFPGAMNYYEKCLSLPLYVGMTDEDVENVVRSLAAALNI